jgi:hypothetical protein
LHLSRAPSRLNPRRVAAFGRMARAVGHPVAGRVFGLGVAAVARDCYGAVVAGTQTAHKQPAAGQCGAQAKRRQPSRTMSLAQSH